jgi:Dullard-like phosphatase family protein
VEALVD